MNVPKIVVLVNAADDAARAQNMAQDDLADAINSLASLGQYHSTVDSDLFARRIAQYNAATTNFVVACSETRSATDDLIRERLK